MPTIKQKKAVKKMVENGRNKKPKSQGKILEECGYSKAVQIAPTKVTQSEGFKEAAKELGVVDFIEQHLKKIQKRMDEEIVDAKYNDLTSGYDRLIKNKELLEGKPTERVEFHELEINVKTSN